MTDDSKGCAIMNKHERTMTCKNCGHHKSYHTTNGWGNNRVEEIQCQANVPIGSETTCGELGNCKRFHSIEGTFV